MFKILLNLLNKYHGMHKIMMEKFNRLINQQLNRLQCNNVIKEVKKDFKQVTLEKVHVKIVEEWVIIKKVIYLSLF
jgi:hypothetical protein